MSGRRTKATLLSITAGFIAGVAGYILGGFVWHEVSVTRYEGLTGLEREENTYRITVPFSELGVIEYGIDQDGDGIREAWSVNVRPRELPRTNIYFTDRNKDEIPDLVSVEIRTGEKNSMAAFSTLDDDGDGRSDRRTFSLGMVDQEDEENGYMVYHDYDFDGFIDSVQERRGNKAIRSYIVEDLTFHNAELIDNVKRIFNVYMATGEWEHVQFTTEGWLPVNVSPN